MRLILGMDEVGRGALFGPCAVGGFVVEEGSQQELLKLGVKDSKKLSPQKRQAVYKNLTEKNLPYHTNYLVSYKPATCIDANGITKALAECVEEIVIYFHGLYGEQLIRLEFDRGLKPKFWRTFRHPSHLKVVEAPCRGEDLYPAVAAASIVAKEERDSKIISIADRYTDYGLVENKGYSTKEHLQAIKKFGIIEGLHRKSYVKNC